MTHSLKFTYSNLRSCLHRDAGRISALIRISVYLLPCTSSFFEHPWNNIKWYYLGMPLANHPPCDPRCICRAAQDLCWLHSAILRANGMVQLFFFPSWVQHLIFYTAALTIRVSLLVQLLFRVKWIKSNVQIFPEWVIYSFLWRNLLWTPEH